MSAADDSLYESVTRARVLMMSEGTVLLLLGGVAIILPGLAAIAITILLGWLFFFGGVVGLLMTLGTQRMTGHQWSRVSAVVALAAGVLLIVMPVRGGDAFMMVLGLFFALDGIFSVLYALEHRRQMSRRWGWMLASGICTLFLAAFVLAWPAASVALLGMLVGIDLVFCGVALFAIATGLREAG